MESGQSSSARVIEFDEQTSDSKAAEAYSGNRFDMSGRSLGTAKNRDEHHSLFGGRRVSNDSGNLPLTDSKTLSETENIPAYERRNVRLDRVNPSSELNSSRVRMVMDEDNRPEIREENSFLHDNVD